MTTKKKLRKKIAELEKRVARLERAATEPSAPLFDEKRVVDLIVGLTTEHVGRLLQQSFREKDLVDAVARAVVPEVAKRVDQAFERRFDRRHLDELADTVAQRVRRELDRDG